ncbi:methylmalonyl-CoA mutase family protein [Lutimonas zeaxanthinifaciens]|uniref:methylmalonyl-CoA mutase family protein n=1 Tax=Lutimonas zeaxanthinifaciens TaxID=3060215 RepID=UPI00265CDD53|nr:methylmalonyl-CoA mutase family protein [Lutimonas sp. YSD2104]WKK65545.1 methylmalonyl-CoA mutase family protein [Lutimonas sp. YSD2104]
MDNDSKDKMLFQEFIPPTKQEWIDKANVDLKGADFDKRLVWKNLNGINLQPFYTLDDQKELLNNTGINSEEVVNFRRINAKDAKIANQLGIKAVEEGMNGLIFEINSTVSPEQLLNDNALDEVSVSFDIAGESGTFISAYKAYIQSLSLEADRIKGYVNLNVFENYLTKGSLEEGVFDDLASLIKTFEKYPNIKSVAINSTMYQNSGSNQVQEIAYTLNSVVSLIEKLAERGISAKQVFDNLYVILGVSSEYFVEIAKFRVFNSLLANIATKYGIKEINSEMAARTSVWSKSVTDANTNMLRSTTEAMSALLGNVNGIELDPYDHEFKKSNDFSSRIAGNITTILKEESYFGKVANPVDGSYYIEEVSLKLAENALSLFKLIEEDGGFISNIENETIQNQIAEIRLNKIKLLSQRRVAMVGVNKYPNLMESISEEILGSEEVATDTKLLSPQRAGLQIEKIRYNTEHFVTEKGFRPVVEIASYGQLVMRKARAAFAFDYMGVSGFDILEEKSFKDHKEAAAKTSVSNSDIVVICSSDPDYEATGLEYIKKFRAKNPTKILLLAGYPKDIQQAMLEAGLDGFIHMKADIYKTLTEIQQKISQTIKPLEI